MPGHVIGTKLPLGYAGAPSQMSDCQIKSYLFPVDTKTAGKTIEFGTAVVFDAAIGGVRPVAAGDTAAMLVGVAVRHYGDPHNDTPNGWFYQPGDTVGVLVRGSIVVPTADSTVAARGAVYVKAADGTVTATAGSNLALAGAKFESGRVEGGLVEITVLTRNA